MIFDIWNRFEESQAVELQLTTPEFSLSLKKATGDRGTTVFSDNSCREEEGKKFISKTLPASSGVKESKDRKEEKGIEVKAPLAGIFYRASSPEAQPFVKLGDHVKKGQVIGIIEAMKMMNEVTAMQDGTVDSILVKDSEMVEYEQSLFRLV